jgi:hypothetical protein
MYWNFVAIDGVIKNQYAVYGTTGILHLYNTGEEVVSKNNHLLKLKIGLYTTKYAILRPLLHIRLNNDTFKILQERYFKVCA